MPRNDDLQKHTLNLYKGDYAKLQDAFPEVGASVIIRKLVRQCVNQIEEQGTNIEAEVVVKL